MCDQRGSDGLCIMPIPFAGVYVCAESAAEEEEVEYGGKGGVCCEEKVCVEPFSSLLTLLGCCRFHFLFLFSFFNDVQMSLGVFKPWLILSR